MKKEAFFKKAAKAWVENYRVEKSLKPKDKTGEKK